MQGINFYLFVNKNEFVFATYIHRRRFEFLEIIFYHHAHCTYFSTSFNPLVANPHTVTLKYYVYY